MRILAAIILFSSVSFAKVEIPTGLNQQDRISTLDILGFGTNSKILTDPYPLGGFAGFEVGVQLESIPVKDLSNLGNTTQDQDYFFYPIISVGKGVYNNLDFFIHFIPFSQGTGISEYSGIVRWGFFQMAYFPISFSVQVNADSANINNQLITKNFGVDLTAGLTTQNFYLYSGVGRTQSQGKFIGGSDGITDNGNTEYEKIKKTHLFLGMGFRVQSIFVTAQMDHFTQPNYSLKLGFRY